MFGPTHRLLKIFSLVLVALLFYFFARVEFLLWNWSLFKNKPVLDILWSFVVGLRFDAAAALSVTAPVLLLAFVPWPKSWHWHWSTLTWVLFSLLQVPFLILNLVDVEFINFVGRRFSYDTLFIVNEIPGKFWNFVTSYWLLFLINTLLVVLFVFCVRRVMTRESQEVVWPGEKKSSVKLWLSHAFLCFVALAVSVVGIRGGLQSKPINFVNANVFTAPLLNNLVLNSTFTFIKSYGAESLKREKYFANKDEMLTHLNGFLKVSALEGKRPAKPQNVMIIILESFGEEFLGPVNGKTYTPFLDSLMAKSLVFKNAYANGRRSIEGVGAVMAGIPALMSEPFISSHFTSNYFLGLGTLVSQKGYATSFFHGGHNGTMYFDSFMQSAGVEKYYGAREYGNAADDDGVWGIWDEPFLQWMLGQMDSLPQPFMNTVFTLSSHQPFKVPEKYQETFPEGPLPILKTIAYTDYALKKFFAEAEKKPWFKDTLFIITADHAALHYRPEYENDIGSYRIPLFFYHPSYSFPKVDTEMIVQQIDILPTVLDFLGLPEKDKNYLGSSVFISGDKTVVNYIDGRYILFAKEAHLRWSPGHNEPQMFAIDDRVGERELSSAETNARKQQLTEKLKATIQYFNEGMWDNKLYYPSK
ncbi:sulfatase-like hydrolase/transferase [Bdellovibrio sp. 22V]|uniref:LTA synthase family protein n=1 Tax=Bdellovibrio sp. 22V TaxID=3044166 RepID=UPI00254339D8|nr:alkaline phosphatase family protein [Bdellovibrio sp. 22V]WII73342.1 sulfatase-like hydrolase/transferase [Bdellovibrio sp. 22V]